MPDIIDLSFRPCQPPFITPIIYWISLDIVHWWRRNSISFVSIKKKKKNYSKYSGDVLFPGRSLLFRKMTTLRFVKRGLLRCRNWLFAKHSVSDTIFGDQSVNNSFVEILWAILWRIVDYSVVFFLFFFQFGDSSMFEYPNWYDLVQWWIKRGRTKCDNASTVCKILSEIFRAI